MPDSPRSTSAALTGLLLVLLAAAVFLPGIPMRDLWNPDEPRYAEVSREMVVLDEWFVPHLNGGIYAEKPPLFFWLSALLQMAGAGYWAGRIVSALAVAGMMLIVWRLARGWFSPRAGVLAAVFLLTTALVTWIGRMGVLDPLLGFCTTLAFYGLVRGRERGGWVIAWFWIGTALGILIKGPVALLITGLAAIAFALADGRPKRFPRHAFWGVPLMLAIVAAWLVPACIQGGEAYTDTILRKQTVGRMVSSWSHRRPFWYYLPTLPLFLFPWVFFVPRAFLWAFRERAKARAVALWFLLGFVAFSAISGKRERYLLPLYPAIALVVAGYLDGVLDLVGRGQEHPASRRLMRWQNGVLLGIAVGFLLFAVGGGEVLDRYAASHPGVVAGLSRLTTIPGSLLLACASLLLGGVAIRGMVAARNAPPMRALRVVVLATLLLWWTFDLVWTNPVNEFKSARTASEKINEIVPKEGPGEWGFFPDTFAGAFNLYTGRIDLPVLATVAEFDAYLAQEGRRAVLTSEGHYERSKRYGPASVQMLLKNARSVTVLDRVGHRVMILVKNWVD